MEAGIRHHASESERWQLYALLRWWHLDAGQFKQYNKTTATYAVQSLFHKGNLPAGSHTYSLSQISLTNENVIFNVPYTKDGEEWMNK